MRILSVVSSIDLQEGKGCTPAWWQLHKALHEAGHELVLSPYLGDPVEAPWWRTYENPCSLESKLFKRASEVLDISAGAGMGTEFAVETLTNTWTKRKWEDHLTTIMREEDPDVIVFFNIPLNQVAGIPSTLRRQFDKPVLYYDGDMPTILPKYVETRGFQFNYYRNADLSEYDAFLVNSDGVCEALRQRGAKNVHPVHYGADPGLYKPIEAPYEYDIAFFGSGAKFREQHTRNMITKPARRRPDIDFIVGGRGYDIQLGPVRRAGWIPLNGFREFCGKAKINLNITRKGHREVYKSSTSRPFELAAMGCCVVSDPYNGLDEWFDIGSEMFIADDEAEALELYEWLLDDDAEREAVGERARNRVLHEHTFADRAEHLVQLLRQYTSADEATVHEAATVDSA